MSEAPLCISAGARKLLEGFTPPSPDADSKSKPIEDDSRVLAASAKAIICPGQGTLHPAGMRDCGHPIPIARNFGDGRPGRVSSRRAAVGELGGRYGSRADRHSGRATGPCTSQTGPFSCATTRLPSQTFSHWLGHSNGAHLRFFSAILLALSCEADLTTLC